MTPKEPKSECCSAPMSVIAATEGTSFYVCSQCDQPTDMRSLPNPCRCINFHQGSVWECDCMRLDCNLHKNIKPPEAQSAMVERKKCSVCNDKTVYAGGCTKCLKSNRLQVPLNPSNSTTLKSSSLDSCPDCGACEAGAHHTPQKYEDIQLPFEISSEAKDKELLEELFKEFKDMCKYLNNKLGNKPCPRCDTNYTGLKWQVEDLIDAARSEAKREERERIINNYKSICELKFNGEVKYFKSEFTEDFDAWEDVLPQKILDVILNNPSNR